MAGLSSNVMNMKFMQKAQERDQKRAQEVEIKKVKDSSEWVLPNRAAVQRNVKSAIKVQSVGYGSIASMTAPQDESETEKEESPKPEVSKDVKQEASKFLDSIMSKSNKDKKRNDKKRKSDNEGSKKKKKKSS